MATGNITRLEGVWPETHERAVRDSAGVNLETKLGNINSNISQLDQEVNGFEEHYTEVDAENTNGKSQLNVDGTLYQSASATFIVSSFPAVGGRSYKISGRVSTEVGTCLYVFLDSNGQALSHGGDALSSGRTYLDLEAVAPEGATQVKVGGNNTYDYPPAVKLLIEASVGLINKVASLESNTAELGEELVDLKKDVIADSFVIDNQTITSDDVTERMILQNGHEVAFPTEPHCTKLIPFSKKNTYIYNGGVGTYELNPAVYYDIDGNIVGAESVASGRVSNLVLTAPASASYVRFCVWDVNETFEVSVSSPVSNLMENVPYFGTKENVAILDFTPGEVSKIISPFSDGTQIVNEFNLLRNGQEWGNPGFNFQYVKLKTIASGYIVTVHDCKDDICPIQFNGQYIGANHAAPNRMLITVSGEHGKDYSDIGSIWSDGVHQFVLVGINNTSRLYLIGENLSEYPLFNFAIPSNGATFTHVSGATHTTAFTAASVDTTQWWPAFASPNTKVYLDGEPIGVAGEYNFREMVVSEIYDIINPASALEIVKSNVGAYTENPKPGDLSGADKYARISITYTFSGADKCIIATSLAAYQELGGGYAGFIQQSPLSINSGQARYLYMPTVHSLNGGETNVDLRTLVDMSTFAPCSIKKIDCDNPQKPVDRWVQLAPSIGFTSGYLFDYGVGGNNRNGVIDTLACHISSAPKMYPHGLDGEMSALENYSAVCFRNYIPRNEMTVAGLLAKNIFEYKGALYIYVDFNGTGFFEVDIPEKYQGMQVEVYDKRENVTLLTQNASDSILIKVGEASPSGGFIVAKINP